jgi:hypothetical protein
LKAIAQKASALTGEIFYPKWPPTRPTPPPAPNSNWDSSRRIITSRPQRQRRHRQRRPQNEILIIKPNPMKTRFPNSFLLSALIAGLSVASTFFFNDVRAAGVFPIATTSAIEYSFSAAFDGSNYLVAISQSGSVTAQLVSQGGALVGSRISTGGFVGSLEGGPSVAFDGTNYLMVWAGAGSTGFRGQFVSKSGGLGAGLSISAVTPSAESVAYGGGKYLACWSDSSTVSGQLVTPDGTLFGPSFTISGSTQNARENAVVFNGTSFFVVFNGGGTYRPNIYGQFVSPAGERIGSTVVINNSTDPCDNPLAVAFDGTNYLVTFNDEVGGLGGAFHIFGRLVNTSGTVLANQITIANDPGAQHFPFAAFDGSSYLVAWNDGASPTNLNLTLRFFDRTGQALGSEFSPFTAQGTNQPVLGAPLFDGTRFLIVGTLGNLTNGFNFASGDVYGTFIPASTAPPQFGTGAAYTNKQFSLSLTGTPGINYAIQMATNLAAASWTSLVTNSPTNGTLTFTDAGATNRSRFYRAVKQ